MRISDSIREAVDRFKRKVATAHKSGGSFVGLALRKNNRAASSLLTRLETRDSRHETRNCRVSCLASRVSSDCQVTFGRYCNWLTNLPNDIWSYHCDHHYPELSRFYYDNKIIVISIHVTCFSKMHVSPITGSFKVRGLSCQLSQIPSDVMDGKRRLVSMSAGNYGKAYAYAVKELGLQATLCMPETAPANRSKLIEVQNTKETSLVDASCSNILGNQCQLLPWNDPVAELWCLCGTNAS